MENEIEVDISEVGGDEVEEDTSSFSNLNDQGNSIDIDSIDHGSVQVVPDLRPRQN